MVWKIAKKEFLLNLMTFKFAVGTILCVVLIAVFMPILVSDYQQKLGQYNKNVADNEAELRKVRVYKNITPTIYRPPSVLSVFSEGLEKRLGNSAPITLGFVPEISYAAENVNPYLSIFSVFDISLIFKIVISILALLVAYDSVSGERQQGTLKLMLSGMVARYQVLLGKLLAGLITLLVPITVAFIVGVIILLSFSMVDLAASDWGRIGLMYIASLIFISAMYNIALLFSCLSRNSAISLVLALFLWVVFVIAIPNTSVYLATQLQPMEPQEKLDAQLELIAEKQDAEHEQIGRWSGVESDVEGAFGHWYPLICDDGALEGWKRRSMLGEPIKIKYADKNWEVKDGYLSGLFKQKYLAKNLARISPICLYENVMSILAETDLVSFQYFMDRVRKHRNGVIDYIRSKTDNFSSLSYFTRCKKGDWEKYEVAMEPYDEEDREKWWQAHQEWKDKKIAATAPLDLQDFPRFIFQPEIVKSLQRAISDLALLVFVNVLFFALTFLAFVKYDVR